MSPISGDKRKLWHGPKDRRSLMMAGLKGFLALVTVIWLGYALVATTDIIRNRRLSEMIRAGDEALYRRNATVDESYKHILLYSDLYGDPQWELGVSVVNDTYFSELYCPETRCIVTSDKNYLPNGELDFDAVLFFAHDPQDMSVYPRQRRLGQVYVVAMLEAPPHTKRSFKNDIGFFNWTQTYRLDSDVLWPYGYFLDKQSHKVIAPSSQPVWRELEQDHFNRSFFRNETLLQLISNKKKMVAWFSSNCWQTPSKRMDVARALEKFLPVDIYGGCGKLKCERSREKECREMLQRDYKFYLAFENSLCKDYITEKVFSTMEYLIIPVVYNGAENHKFLPPNSYLDVLKYESIEELAKHMRFLADHPEEYIKYFWWKEFYYVRSGLNFCDLCVKLHQPNAVQRRQNYWDLDGWYQRSLCRTKPEIKIYT